MKDTVVTNDRCKKTNAKTNTNTNAGGERESCAPMETSLPAQTGGVPEC